MCCTPDLQRTHGLSKEREGRKGERDGCKGWEDEGGKKKGLAEDEDVGGGREKEGRCAGRFLTLYLFRLCVPKTSDVGGGCRKSVISAVRAQLRVRA